MTDHSANWLCNVPSLCLLRSQKLEPKADAIPRDDHTCRTIHLLQCQFQGFPKLGTDKEAYLQKCVDNERT